MPRGGLLIHESRTTHNVRPGLFHPPRPTSLSLNLFSVSRVASRKVLFDSQTRLLILTKTNHHHNSCDTTLIGLNFIYRL